MAFFEQVFDLERKFVSEDGYGELNTGQTTLAFASHTLVKTKLVIDYLSVDKSDKTFGIEVGFTTDSVREVYERAISFGAKSIKEPTEMPWGQTVSYIKSPDGTLVEICSAIRR